MAPLFYNLCFKLSPGEELGQTGTERGAFSCAEQQIAVLWAGENCSSPSPLSQRSPRSNREQSQEEYATCGWGGGGSLEFWSTLTQIKSALRFFSKRIWDENLYYIHKQYSDFFKIRNLAKVDPCGQSWRNGRKHLAWDICALVPLFYQSPLFLV